MMVFFPVKWKIANVIHVFKSGANLDLVTFTEDIIGSFEGGLDIHAVYTDLQTPFGIVNHVVFKRDCTSMVSAEILYIHGYSYIDNRTQEFL